MTERQILIYPDARLRVTARPVDAFDDDLRSLVDDLIGLLRTNKAIGLSATQLGDDRQVFVMDLSEGAKPPEVFVNPETLAKQGWGLVEESCLSLPGISANVIRSVQMKVRAMDQTGAPFERELTGMDAVCFQHEMDHLAGKLFIDRLSVFRRFRLRGELRALEQRAAA